MELIGIGGKMQSGKDTTAKIIMDLKKDKPWKILRFADSVKDIVCVLLNCTRDDLENINFKNKELGKNWDKYIVRETRYASDINRCEIKYTSSSIEEAIKICEKNNMYFVLKEKMTPRLLLQLIGTECGRNIIHPNIWINCLKSKYDLYKNDYNIIIPDLRFNNEAEFIEKNNGKIIIIYRKIDDESDHPSENSLSIFSDYVTIENNGTTDDLKLKIQTILKQYNI